MQTYTVSAEPLKAAMLHQSNNDVRYYLMGIYFDAENGRVIGTNGNTAVIVHDEKVRELGDSFIAKINGTVPAKASEAHIVMLDEKHGYIYYSGAKGPVQVRGQLVRHFYDVIEGSYPDVDRIKSRANPKAVSEVGFNGEYMGLASKTVRALRSSGSGLNVTFSGAFEIIKATGGGECSHEHEIYIMPMRMCS